MNLRYQFYWGRDSLRKKFKLLNVADHSQLIPNFEHFVQHNFCINLAETGPIFEKKKKKLEQLKDISV